MARIVAAIPIIIFFFFSSRRRHTRCSRDWSSDVCSSDLMLFEESKPQFDGDAAALLFFEPVGMRSGERLDERRLAVVDMPGRADDDAFRCRRLHCRSHGDLPAKIPFRSPMLLEGRFRRQTGVLLGCYLAAAISSTIDCAATREIGRAHV